MRKKAKLKIPVEEELEEDQDDFEEKDSEEKPEEELEGDIEEKPEEKNTDTKQIKLDDKTIVTYLKNHEARISAIESFIFRLKTL